MDTRAKWAIGMAVIGGIAASMGSVQSLPDTLLGAALWGGVAFGIGTIVMRRKARKTN